MQAGQSDLDFFRPSKAFLDSPAGSFDKVVMERADNALVVPVSFGWRDVGSWRAIQDAVPADADGNLIRGDVMALDVANSLIHAQGRLIGAIGVRDLIIVETNDAVLVANRERTQQVGALDGAAQTLAAVGVSAASAGISALGELGELGQRSAVQR